MGDITYAISIHTPIKGVTKGKDGKLLTVDDFNPHTHKGCDAASFDSEVMYMISIHTPIKGVTCSWIT